MPCCTARRGPADSDAATRGVDLFSALRCKNIILTDYSLEATLANHSETARRTDVRQFVPLILGHVSSLQCPCFIAVLGLFVSLSQMESRTDAKQEDAQKCVSVSRRPVFLSLTCLEERGMRTLTRYDTIIG